MFPCKQSSICCAVVVAVSLAVLAGISWAEDSAAPKPPPLPPLGKVVEDLLKELKKESQIKQYSAVDSADQPHIFDVTVPYGKKECTVRVSEQAASWQYPDKSEVRFATFWMNVTSWWQKSIPIPPALVKAVNDANDTANWISYSIHENPDRTWTVSCHCQVFMKGMSADVFNNYLALMPDAAASHAAEFMQFIRDDDAGPAAN
jgi:hypothetical protein